MTPSARGGNGCRSQEVSGAPASQIAWHTRVASRRGVYARHWLVCTGSLPAQRSPVFFEQQRQASAARVLAPALPAGKPMALSASRDTAHGCPCSNEGSTGRERAARQAPCLRDEEGIGQLGRTDKQAAWPLLGATHAGSRFVERCRALASSRRCTPSRVRPPLPDAFATTPLA